MDDNNAKETVLYLVHTHLKDMFRHLQTKVYAQEPVPAMVGVKGGQVEGLFIEVYA